jgi:diketogulonate reductase-like aldo/keto reductase
MEKSNMIKLHTGKEMPILGLGTSTLTEDNLEFLQLAITEAGYRHIDTAEYDSTIPIL